MLASTSQLSFPLVDLAMPVMADALKVSAAAFFQFENEEANERTLRKWIEGLIADASAESFSVIGCSLNLSFE